MKVKVCENYRPVSVYGILFKGKMVYIGITTRGVATRVMQHFGNAQKTSCRDACPLFYDFIRTNPTLDDYEVEVFEQCSTESAETRERFYIDKFNTHGAGLNVTRGGNWPKGSEHYLYGKRVGQHVVEASIRARKGVPLTEEHKEKIRQANLGRTDQSIKVRCLDTGEIFDSIGLAAESIGVHPAALHNHFNGKSKACRGKRYERVGFPSVPYIPKMRDALTPKQIENVRAGSLKRKDHCIALKCITTGETFSSVAEASRATGESVTAIRRNVYKKTKSTSNNLKFERVQI